MKYIARMLAVFLVSLTMTLAWYRPAFANSPTLEYQVKAAYLHNFIQFVNWPDSVFSSPEDSIVIAVYGEDKLGSALDSLSLVSIKGHPVKVKRCKTVEEISNSHVLFLTKTAKQKSSEILNQFSTEGMLTIGEENNFVRDGGVINFILKDDKIRFEVNLASASDSGLTISSQLLKLALKVYDENEETRR